MKGCTRSCQEEHVQPGRIAPLKLGLTACKRLTREGGKLVCFNESWKI